MRTTLTMRLPDKEARELQTLCDQTGRTRSEVMREALHKSQRILGPEARASGWRTEEDVLNDVT